MKYLTFILMVVLLPLGYVKAQDATAAVTGTDYFVFGNTLNIAGQLGYSVYAGEFVPVVYADYEFEIADNFTLAPSVEYYSYQNQSYWGDATNAYKNYTYRESLIPLGCKGSYYLNNLLNTGNRWDVYVAVSFEYIIRTTNWDDGNTDKPMVNNGASALAANMHIGTEYHVDKRFGMYVDLSTGVSVLGIAIHRL